MMLETRVRVIHSGHRSMAEPRADGEERRGSPRRTTRTVGQIFPGSSQPSILCMITDISGTGARIELLPGWVNPYRGASSIGAQFRLFMRIDKMEVRCQIVHVDDNTMGVQFVSPAQPAIK